MRRPTLDYLKTESGSGLVLAIAAVVALGLANSRVATEYFAVLALPVPVRIGAFGLTLSVADWVRSVLMPIFFLVLGMSMKFETLRGELSNPRRLALPALAAIGGLIAPAIVGVAIGGDQSSAWTAGLATDGAAALAVFAVTGPRVAPTLRVLLMSVALADNVAAVIVTATLRAASVRWPMLAGAVVALVALALLSRWKKAPFLFYAAGFVVVWGFVMKSGLDPALAGVACAFTVPIGARRPGQDSLIKYFQDSLHGYVAFAILPLFVVTAAGVAVRQIHLADLAAPAPLAVMAALAIGKPLGVFGLCAAAIALKLVRRPMGASWTELAAVSLLCGVGFTMGYYVAGIGPADPAPAVRLAVLIGSGVATIAGGGLLALTERRTAAAEASLV